MSNNFLLEVLTEDVPASLQLHACSAIKEAYENSLKTLNVSYNELNVFHTPRRLIVSIKGLPLSTLEQGVEKKGPLKDAPAKAVSGFLKSCKNYKEHEIIFKDIKGKLYYFFKQDDVEVNMEEKIKHITLDVLSSIKFKRSLFWNDSKVYWARPIRSIVAMFNQSFLSFSFAGVQSCKNTFGHMFLKDNCKIEFNSIDGYFNALVENKVMYNQDERVDYIIKNYNDIAEKRDFAILDENSKNENVKRVLKLIKTEVAYLVEYPFLLELDYNTSYTKELPADLIVETIEKNQKYLATFSKEDKELLNTFIIVSNNFAETNNIVSGNLKVVDARLKDALFFYKDDALKKPLHFYNKLEDIDFFKGLGNYQDKTKRELLLIKQLMLIIENNYQYSDIKDALSYLKVDIASSTVQELPEFQGTFSKYYLPLYGVEQEIANAIASQYKPVGNDDALPKAGLPSVVALASKLETLLGFFAIGKNTSGSGDVLGLRRNALGILRIILFYKLDIDLNEVFANYSKYSNVENINIDYAKDIKSFMVQRLYYYLRQSHNHYLIKAAFGYLETDDRFNILKGYKNLFLLEELEKQDKLDCLLAAYKRLYNINKSSNIQEGFSLNANLLQSSEEIELFNFLQELNQKQDAEEILASMCANIKLFDNFFDNVKVQDDNENIRNNRQLMVKIFVDKLQNIAYFQEIVA